MRTGSLSLLALGLLGVGFFVATDPRLGWGTDLDGERETNIVDAAHNAGPGTMVGVAGSGLTMLAGVWLAARRIA